MFEVKEALKRIRNYLAGNLVGATRDETLLHEIIKLLFCHFHLENSCNLEESSIPNYYKETFEKVKIEYKSLFDSKEKLELDDNSILYIHLELNAIDIFSSDRDPIGDAYEIFIGNTIKGQEGQFFTPKNAVELLINIAKPKLTDRIIDPACGAGSFLVYTIQYLLRNNSIDQIKNNLENLFGIDKDNYLSYLAKIHIAGFLKKIPKIVCEDSLKWKENLENYPNEEEYDIVFSNPPYGSSIVSGTEDTLKNYSLAYKWSQSKKTGEWKKTNNLNLKVPPQVVFIERCIKLAKTNGKIYLVLPESLISSKKYGYVVQFIRETCSINAVIGMPSELFKTSGKSGTHTKTCLLCLEKGESSTNIFFAEAKWCGNDSRGKKIDKDDLPLILSNYQNYLINKTINPTEFGYIINSQEIENNILAPRYYNAEISSDCEILKNTHNLIKIGSLIDKGIIEIKTGDEIGKMAYGTGNIPFVRTSDISNWEVKIDPKQGVSEDIYNQYYRKQDIQINDILMVRDGTYLIGTCALLTEYDIKILYQSHLYKIRVKENNLNLTPHLLLAILSSDFVQKQIKAKRITQDIIDSLGDRIKDILIPIPKSDEKCRYISEIVRKSIFERIEARELARKARIDVLL